MLGQGVIQNEHMTDAMIPESDDPHRWLEEVSGLTALDWVRARNAETTDELVGDDGVVLEALQELTRLAVHRQTGNRARLMLDIGGYRARRRTELTEIGTRAAQRVLDEGQAVKLAPMTPFERKVVHDAVAAVDGVHSESEGEEPERRVVVLPGDE